VALCAGKGGRRNLNTCDACGVVAPSSVCTGVLDVPEHAVTEHRPLKRALGKRRKWVDVNRVIPSYQHLRLMAFWCSHCGSLDVIDVEGHDGRSDTRVEGHDGRSDTRPAEVVLCDDCDAVCGIGSTLAEARQNSIALGGWTGGEDTDQDLCPACTPKEHHG
jgi:hypothetical protein